MAPTETRAITVQVLSVGPHSDDHVALRKMLAATSYPFRPNCQFELTAADDVEGAFEVQDSSLALRVRTGKTYLEDAPGAVGTTARSAVVNRSLSHG